MHAFKSHLLRRTAMALVAVGGLLMSAGSQAAVITLNNTSGNSCSYSSMSVQPDGSFTVSCNTSQVNPGTPGTISLANQGDVGSYVLVTMTAVRSGGATGAVSVTYTATGDGCANGGGVVSWADNEQTGKQFPIATNVSGSCTVALSNVTGGATLSTPSSITFNVTTGAPPQQPVSASCPAGYAEPTNLAKMNLGGLGNPLLAMAASNQIVSIPLPAVQPGYSTGQIAFSESAGGAYTPQPVLLNISISKCRGYIDTDYTNRCNLQSSNGNYNSISWFAQPYSVITSAASANLRGYCWAPSSEGQWYINAKWSYSTCAFGAQVCGFAVQQNYGPY